MKAAELKTRIIMGLDRNQKTPCGFAFVEYYLHAEAVACMRYISGMKLDERVIRCDLDPGYKEGRQFGRGRSGGQVRDEFRQEFDSGRGQYPLSHILYSVFKHQFSIFNIGQSHLDCACGLSEWRGGSSWRADGRE